MSDSVKLSYKRVGEKYVGLIEHGAELFEFKDGLDFAAMMMHANRVLVLNPGAELYIQRTDRAGLLPVKLEPLLLKLLRDDPLAYIKANTAATRVVDMRADGKVSALAASDKQPVPRTSGLRHGLDTVADAFGERIHSRAKAGPGGTWIYEHPATGRWADLRTIEHWLGTRNTEVFSVDSELKRGWLTVAVAELLRTGAERFYYPREWNDYGSWITREQLAAKLEKYLKEKSKYEPRR